MRKRLLSMLLTVCMVLTLLPGFTQPVMAAGEGTGTVANGAFTLNISGVNIITNADQLAYLAQQVNAGASGWSTASYKLGNDINVSSYSNWKPIGNPDFTFDGIFDGGGHTISNLRINTIDATRFYGLFGDVANGILKNVGLSGVSINVTSAANGLYVGGLAGNTDGTIENCFVTGAIAGTVTHTSAHFGGLAGRNYYGTVQNCYSTATVSVTGAGSYSVGGLAGNDAQGRISNCYWLSTATANGIGTGLPGTGNCNFTGTNTLAAVVTVGGTNTSSLLDALNAWLNNKARTDLHTWIPSGSYPVFGPLWTPPTYTATVTVQKDGSLWTGSGKSFSFYQNGTKKYDLTLSGSTATSSALAGTYDVYDGTSDTGVDISVSSGGGNAATVNYYTLALGAGTGTTSPTGNGVYLPGKSVVIDATVNTGYVWSKWTSSNTALLPDQTTKSVGITMPAGTITLTATAAPAAYSITYQLNGGTVSVANPSSYTVESAAITLNIPTRSGYSFLGWSGTGLTGSTNQTVTISTGSTENKTYTANWKADKPSAPAASIVTAKTDTSLTITTQNGYEYCVDGTNWYSGTGSYTFTGLSPNTAYNLVCRKAAVSAGDISSASDASEALSVSTKKASTSVSVPAPPTIGTGDSRPTSDTITINTVEGNEYYISTSNTAPTTWPASGNDYFKATDVGVHTFTGLNAGTQYYIHVRVAETEDVMSSASVYAVQYTLPATPLANAVTINYATETISFDNIYEVSTSADFSTTIASGDTLQPGMNYYVRVKAASGVPGSEAVSFTVSARPDTPSDGAHSFDYEHEKITFGSVYEVYTTTSGGITVASNTTTITPGSSLYIRVKSTDSAPASGWTTINVPARPETAGLSISTSKSDTTITVTEITGAEYSKDGGTTWQSSNEFTGLDADTDYDITIRYAAAVSAFASDALPSVTVRTKTSAGDAPSVPSLSAQTDHAITIDTVAGCQYAITTSDVAPTTWGVAETITGTKTFSSLSAATRYYVWVRVAETETAAPSSSSRINVYTAAATPAMGEGYTIDYSAETIIIASGYEVSTTDDFGTTLTSGASITPGSAYYVRKTADTATTPNTPASEAVSLNLPSRPSIPAASAADETAAGKNDGRISGVTAAMEWKATGGTYTAVTADQESNGISGLPDGIYYVRYMAVSGTGFKSDEQVITIAAGHTITVTFHSQSGSAVEAIAGKVYGDSVTAPVDPVRSGFYFAGWYKEAACTNPWTFTLDTLTDHITLFAKWSDIPTYTVTGRIVDDTSLPIEGATVRMMQGATQFGTTGVTDIHGDFVIDNIPPGTYNLVTTKGTKTAIIKVEVTSGDVAIGNASLPSGNANSVLVVSGSATPNVVVGGLDSEAGTQLAGSSNPLADRVEVKLTVEKRDAFTATNGSEVTGAVTAAGKQLGMILAIDVSKTVNDIEDTSYNQTSGMIEINIPLPAELQGKATYAIYRYHGAAVDTITETPNADLERIVVDRTNWTIALYANKFSTYAIGYTNPASPRGGGGGGAATNPASTTAAAIESQKTVALPYYVEKGKEVFIGLAKDASGTMKYIAPEGVTILFRENPKSFNDIAGHWAKDNIDFVTQRELFLGTGDGNFSPQSGMTRAMFATVIGRLYERSYGEPLPKDNYNFTDVGHDAYYEAYINWASDNNIITGIGDGLFKPDREITRQEMAAILYRFAEFLSVLPSGLEKTQLNYPDAAGISSWATEAAGYCQQTGIITGRLGGNFVPQGTATRAEVAAILQRFIESSVK